MKFSKPGQYALRSMIYLATSSQGRAVTIEEIARETNLPKHFLSKVFQDLVHSNLVVSQKGPNGGVALTRRPKEISLREIIEAAVGPLNGEDCFLGLGWCNELGFCPIHKPCDKSWKKIIKILDKTPLSSLSEIKHKKYKRHI